MKTVRSPLTALIRPTDSRFYTLFAALRVEIQTRVYNDLRSARGGCFLSDSPLRLTTSLESESLGSVWVSVLQERERSLIRLTLSDFDLVPSQTLPSPILSVRTRCLYPTAYFNRTHREFTFVHIPSSLSPQTALGSSNYVPYRPERPRTRQFSRPGQGETDHW